MVFRGTPEWKSITTCRCTGCVGICTGNVLSWLIGILGRDILTPRNQTSSLDNVAALFVSFGVLLSKENNDFRQTAAVKQFWKFTTGECWNWSCEGYPYPHTFMSMYLCPHTLNSSCPRRVGLPNLISHERYSFPSPWSLLERSLQNTSSKFKQIFQIPPNISK